MLSNTDATWLFRSLNLPALKDLLQKKSIMAWSVPHILTLNQLSEAGLKKILKKAFGRAILGIQLRGRLYS